MVGCVLQLGRNALLWAASGGHLAAVQYLVELKNDVHVTDKVHEHDVHTNLSHHMHT